MTQPILEDPPIHPEQFRIRSYTYHYHANYGSEKIDEAKLDVHHFTIAKDRKSITVQVKGLREGYVHEIELTGIKSTTGDPLLHPVAAYTLNKIPKKRD
ncbi:MAG: hypothetical protein HOH33_16015 [Verrucomicrobia bacterium]|nr:hypothetical protein [Verrucomicrobiota bacterium]